MIETVALEFLLTRYERRRKVPSISHARVEAFLADLRTAAGTDADQGVAEWFEANSDLVARFLRLPSANFSKSAKFSK